MAWEPAPGTYEPGAWYTYVLKEVAKETTHRPMRLALKEADGKIRTDFGVIDGNLSEISIGSKIDLDHLFDDVEKTPEQTPRLFGNLVKPAFKPTLVVVDGDVGPCYLCYRRCNTRFLKTERDPGMRTCLACAREHLNLV